METTLPNGKTFQHWKDETLYTRVLHVRAHAAPDGDGSEEHPFSSIQQAADAARPGSRILIHGGVYHETVRPSFGGSGPDQMICFEGAKGEDAVITGAEEYTGLYYPSEGWKRSQFLDRSNAFADPGAKLYALRLPRKGFDGSNPFGMINGGTSPWFYRDFAKLFHTKTLEEQKTVVCRRGMIFVDGERLRQVANYYEMGALPGSFYVEDDGIHVHIRLFDDGDPKDHQIEYTAREQCFAPEEKYLGYLHLKNLTFEKAGTGFPPPQRGAVSVECGHHWIIEGCTVRQVNGVGMDIGFQAPARMADAERGHMYVTGCRFEHCGFSGLVGTCGQSEKVDYIEQRQEGLYIADNVFSHCCYLPNEDSMEAAALKIHHTRDSMVVNNRILDTAHGCGMWLDASHMNLAVRGNVVLRTFTRRYGAITIECSRDDIEVSGNVIVQVSSDNEERGGWGLMTIACEQVRAHRNVILGCQNCAVYFDDSGAQRYTDGKGCTGLDNDLTENIFASGRCALHLHRLCNVSQGNVFGNFSANGYIQVPREEIYTTFSYWQDRLKKDTKGAKADFSWSLSPDGTFLSFAKPDGEEARLMLGQPAAGQMDRLLSWLREA